MNKPAPNANIPPVVQPAPPTDPGPYLPPAPVFPPTQQDVLAVDHRSEVGVSPDSGTIVVAQAAVAEAPPYLLAALNQLRLDIRADIRGTIVPDLKRLLNKERGDGRVVPYDVVPLPNGDDPTQAPLHLTPSTSLYAVYGLDEEEFNAYLTKYGVGQVPPGADLLVQKKGALLEKII